jgi:hypothetical protein
LQDCKTLLDEYGGSLRKLHRISSDSRDLEKRLVSFYGVGPVTMNIFLRELRPFWRKADPDPLPIVSELASRYMINLGKYKRNSITFVRVEAGLIRLRKSLK